MTKLRMILVEDQLLVRDALAQLLNLQQDFEVVGTACDGIAAQSLIGEHKPDLVLTDIEMPNLDGLGLCVWLKQHHAEIKPVIVTTFNRSGYIQRALQAGARGFVLKEVPVEVLANNIRAVASGVKVFDPELVMQGLADQDPLTERERQVLRQAEEGLTTAQIACMMHLSEGTVRNYLSEAMSKLYANSRSQAAKTARDKGWL